jgi:hypothetical protein
VDACVGIRSVGGLEDGEFSRRGEVDRGFCISWVSPEAGRGMGGIDVEEQNHERIGKSSNLMESRSTCLINIIFS